MKNLRAYISGPISGLDLQERVEAFKRAQIFLEGLGFEVFNPMENGLPANSSTHAHMHRDLSELTNEEHPYHVIYMLRRWTHSKGCKVEFDVATAIGMEVYFEESQPIIKFA